MRVTIDSKNSEKTVGPSVPSDLVVAYDKPDNQKLAVTRDLPNASSLALRRGFLHLKIQKENNGY